jgi:hypothetical protein
MDIYIDVYLFDEHWSSCIASFMNRVSISWLMKIIFTLVPSFRMGLGQKNEGS